MSSFISGLTNKRLLVSVFLLFLAGIVFGAEINIIPPHFTGNNPDETREINNEVEDYFINFRRSLRNDLDFLPDSINKLAGAFANTSVFSSDGASQRGYEGYKAFSFTVGAMGALQFPKNFPILDEIKNAGNSDEGEMGFDFIKDNMDIGLGFDIQALNAQLGINTSKFLLKGLYLGFKLSMYDTNRIKILPLPGFSFKTMSVGINVSYQLISQKRSLLGLLVWRGLNLGTGFIWQNTSLGLTLAPPIEENLKYVAIPISGVGEVSMPLNPVIYMNFDTTTYIVPVEAMTSMRLLGFLNVAFGAGFDIAFGRSVIKTSGSFNVDESDIRGLPQGVRMDEPPKLELRLPGKSSPSLLNLKAMGAVGFNIGPFIIDIPVTYYLRANGYSAGLTLGFTL